MDQEHCGVDEPLAVDGDQVGGVPHCNTGSLPDNWGGGTCHFLLGGAGQPEALLVDGRSDSGLQAQPDTVLEEDRGRGWRRRTWK